jgi:hypothetical protein
MSIIPISSCPPWCDPRAHVQHDAEDREHRSAGMTCKPVAADTEFTVRTIQNAGLSGSTSVPMVRLLVRDLDLNTDAETDLDPADARMLAAALLVEAERVEALLRRLRTVA